MGGEGDVYGIDTPATGFYNREGLRVLHMGTDLDRSRQLPTLAAHAALPVTLVGKMADVTDCPEAESLPCVPTQEVLSTTLEAIRERSERGFGRYTGHDKGLRAVCRPGLWAPPTLLGQFQRGCSPKFA